MSSGTAITGLAMSPTAQYAYPVKALTRWATQHLRWQADQAGNVEAVFRLEGSTCGNVPLVMLYEVGLGPRAEGWPIRRLSVQPEPNDDGHRAQCAFRADEGQWREELQAEQPCLGQPVAAALAWSPTVSPEGCLCTAASRAHKWRIVLQTLHWALMHSPATMG